MTNLRIFLKMVRPSLMASTMVAKLSSLSVRSATDRETSVPFLPMATPMCASLSAGASLTPSPVMVTMSPFALSALMMRSLCSGLTRAKMAM